MDLGQLAASAITGIGAALVTMWGDKKLVAWRLRVLETRVGKTEHNVTELQQRVARIEP